MKISMSFSIKANKIFFHFLSPPSSLMYTYYTSMFNCIWVWITWYNVPLVHGICNMNYYIWMTLHMHFKRGFLRMPYRVIRVKRAKTSNKRRLPNNVFNVLSEYCGTTDLTCNSLFLYCHALLCLLVVLYASIFLVIIFLFSVILSLQQL